VELRLWLAFAVLEAVLCFIPGPAVLCVVGNAMRRGIRHGLAAALGIVAGNTSYFALSALGVVAILASSPLAFTVVTYAGAAYLGYLGLRALFGPAAPVEEEAAVRKGSSFVTGFVTQISNPKAVIFFVALLPQFIDRQAVLAPQIVVLALISMAIEYTVLAIYASAASAARRTVRSQRAVDVVERTGGAVLVGVALKLVLQGVAR
jgi:homoserine/homoserine lactone efflux protein